MRTLALVFFLGACKGATPLPTPTGDVNDRDGDGFNQAQDCNDQDPDINPDADDMFGDNVDNNCDGIDGVDADGDESASEESGGDDCDDTNPDIRPGRLDIGWNEIDEDCTGADRHDYKTIGLGNTITCAVKSIDELVCVGDDTGGLITNMPTDGTDWTDLAGGDGWFCGIDAGVIRCWGDDEFGVISGIPSIEDHTGSSWQQIDAGRDHACAVTDLGAGYCWGRDDFGQVNGVNLLEGYEIEQVAPGDNHTCVTINGGFAQCFGDNAFEQTTPRPAQARFLQLSSGDNFTCGIQLEGRASCWGEENNGQIAPVNPIGPYTDIASYRDSSCGIIANDLTCWGDGGFEQIFPPDRTATQVEMGPSHGCARNGVGLVFCWGDNQLGQLDLP